MLRGSLLNSTSWRDRVLFSPDGDGLPAPAPPNPPPAPPPYRQPEPAPQPQRPARDPDDVAAGLRAEAASWRVQAQTAKAERDAADERARQATEGATRQVEEARTSQATVTNKIKQRAADAELRAAAASMGIVDTDLIPLIDRSTITVDDEGNVTGAAEAVTAFKAKKPEFFRQQQQQPPGPGPTPQRTGSFNQPPPPNPNPPPATVSTLNAAEYQSSKDAAARSLRR